MPNGSFETYTQCPNTRSQIYFAPPWTGPTTNESDYLNACSNVMNVPHYGGIGSAYPWYLLAKEGKAYAGIFLYQQFNSSYREYLQCQLTATLNADACYYVEFFAANNQRHKFTVNNVAAAFSATAYPVNLASPGIVINLPQHITNYGNPVLPDTVNWQKISGIYKAGGNEKFIVIGNFKDNANTDTVRLYPPGIHVASYAYTFIDAVSVYSINPNGVLPWSYRDTVVYLGDSVYIGNKMGGMNFNPQWFTSGGNYITTNAGIYVSPAVTSSYVVQFTVCGVQRSDTVVVTVLSAVNLRAENLRLLREQLKIFPVPADQN